MPSSDKRNAPDKVDSVERSEVVCREPAELLRILADTGDFIASETDEDRFGWGLAVDPILDVVAVGVTLADFVLGLADRGNHFFLVHPDGRAAILLRVCPSRRSGGDPEGPSSVPVTACRPNAPQRTPAAKNP